MSDRLRCFSCDEPIKDNFVSINSYYYSDIHSEGVLAAKMTFHKSCFHDIAGAEYDEELWHKNKVLDTLQQDAKYAIMSCKKCGKRPVVTTNHVFCNQCLIGEGLEK